MKKFRFRLESLVRYRAFLERRKQLEVAQARSDVLACERTIAQLHQARQATGEQVVQDLARGMDAVRFQNAQNYMSGLASEEMTAQGRRNTLLSVLSSRQKELAEKSVEKKAIEKIKERRKEEYYAAAMKEEQKTLDDIVILRRARNENNEK